MGSVPDVRQNSWYVPRDPPGGSYTNPMADILIEEWRPGQPGSPMLEGDLDALGEVLHATVHAGASVGFVLPFSRQEARSYWTS